jgi:uridylate kinase
MADNIGMLGTVINAVLLRGRLAALGAHGERLMTAIPIDNLAEPYIRLRALRHLDKGSIVLLACGNGQPFTTTDYPSNSRPTHSWWPRTAPTACTTPTRTSTPTPAASTTTLIN